MKYDFDTVISRKGSGCIKWDVKDLFGVDSDADLLPFWIADQDFPVLPEIQEALRKRVDHPMYGYTMPSSGSVSALTQWYSRRHGWEFSPSEVISGIGVVTVLSYAIRALTEPGDKIALFSPVYDPFFALIKNGGRSLVDVPMEYQGGQYTPDLELFEKELAAGVKALILCNPHNPVGKVWTREELTDIAHLCKKYNTLILSDDVHGDIVMKGHKYVPMASVTEARDRLVTFTAISKTFNLAGLGASATIVQNHELFQKLNGALRDVWLFGPNVMAFPAMEAAYTCGDEWVDELNEYLTDNSRYVSEQCRKDMPDIKVADHQGTFLMWLDMTCFALSSDELTSILAKEYGIALGNGAHYGKQCDGFMRLNMACPRETLEKGFESLKRFYKNRR